MGHKSLLSPGPSFWFGQYGRSSTGPTVAVALSVRLWLAQKARERAWRGEGWVPPLWSWAPPAVGLALAAGEGPCGSACT